MFSAADRYRSDPRPPSTPVSSSSRNGPPRPVSVRFDGVLDIVAVDTEEPPTATRLARHPGLSDADVSVLACAEARGKVAVLDEAADVEGIEIRGTASLVLSAVKHRTLSPDEGRRTINAMIDHGWDVAPDLYAKIV